MTQFLSIIGILLGGLFLTGCSTAGAVREQIKKDLSELLEIADCPSTCEALKGYIRNEIDKVK